MDFYFYKIVNYVLEWRSFIFKNPPEDGTMMTKHVAVGT